MFLGKYNLQVFYLYSENEINTINRGNLISSINEDMIGK